MTNAIAPNKTPTPSDQTGWGIGLSLAIHLLLVLLIVFWPGFGSSKRQIFMPTYQVKLVGSPNLPKGPPGKIASLPAKVNSVKPALPKPPKKAPEVVAPKPKPKPLESSKPKEAIGNKKTVKRLKPKVNHTKANTQALDNKIKRLQAKVAEDRRLDSALDRLESKISAKAGQTNRAMAGAGTGSGGGGGMGGQGMALRFQVYYTELWGRISRHWVVPEALVSNAKGLEAVVVIKILKNGTLDKAWLEQSSGNSRYDQSCLRAVERAAPYPPLPSGIREKNHEVGIRFKPEDMPS